MKEKSKADDRRIERLRSLCIGLPEVEERLSHGEPTWFHKGKRSFVMLANHHHNDRLAFWCAAAEGAQEAFLAADPKTYFRPPYVGHRGWLGVYLDVECDWDAIGEIVRDAYQVTAKK